MNAKPFKLSVSAINGIGSIRRAADGISEYTKWAEQNDGEREHGTAIELCQSATGAVTLIVMAEVIAWAKCSLSELIGKESELFSDVGTLGKALVRWSLDVTGGLEPLAQSIVELEDEINICWEIETE